MSVNSRSRGFTADYIPLVTGGYELVSDGEISFAFYFDKAISIKSRFKFGNSRM